MFAKHIARSEIAALLKCHQRTVTRAVHGKFAPFKVPDEQFPLSKITGSFNTTRQFLLNCIAGKDDALTIKQAANYLGMTRREFTYLRSLTRLPSPAAKLERARWFSRNTLSQDKNIKLA